MKHRFEILAVSLGTSYSGSIMPRYERAETLEVWLIGGDDNFVGQLLAFWGIKIQRKRKRKIFSKMKRG